MTAPIVSKPVPIEDAPAQVIEFLQHMLGLGHKMFVVSQGKSPELQAERTEYRCRGCFKGAREYRTDTEMIVYTDIELGEQCSGQQYNAMLWRLP